MFDSETVKMARRKSGLSAADFGAALGYRHDNRHHMRQQVYDMETGRKPVSPMVARLAEMFRRHGVPKDFWAPRIPQEIRNFGQKENE